MKTIYEYVQGYVHGTSQQKSYMKSILLNDLEDLKVPRSIDGTTGSEVLDAYNLGIQKALRLIAQFDECADKDWRE